MQPSTKASFEYIPAMDGLRAISFLLVFFSHADIVPMVPAGLGIIIFFVISSFLLTRQMVAEMDSTGTLSLKAFYLRRVFRLAPALLVYIIVFVPLLRALGSEVTPVQVASGLFYFANFYQIFHSYPLHNPFPITWTLSVEEHYYILFPLIMLCFSRSLRGLLFFMLPLTVVALAWRIELYHLCHGIIANRPDVCALPTENRNEGTDACFDVILFGAITALAMHFYGKTIQRLFVNRVAFSGALGIILICMFIRDEMFRETFHYTIRALCVAVIILNIVFGQYELPRRILSNKLLVLIGKMSYSLYLFHFGTMITIEAIDHHRQTLGTPLNLFLYTVISIVLATLSYQYIEKPTMKLRKRFGSHNKAVVAIAEKEEAQPLSLQGNG